MQRGDAGARLDGPVGGGTSRADDRNRVLRPTRTGAGGLRRPGFGWLKLAVFVLASLPACALVVGLVTGDLGINPVETITHSTGEQALRFLLLSLSMTPLRILLRTSWPIRLRRMLGLFAYFYASLHVLTYVLLDLQLSLDILLEDLLERPYILAGSTAFLLLTPLALTSTKGWTRRLGRRWLALHRLVYIASTAVIVHYVWLARGDRLEPWLYLLVLLLLLTFRFAVLVKPLKKA